MFEREVRLSVICLTGLSPKHRCENTSTPPISSEDHRESEDLFETIHSTVTGEPFTVSSEVVHTYFGGILNILFPVRIRSVVTMPPVGPRIRVSYMCLNSCDDDILQGG